MIDCAPMVWAAAQETYGSAELKPYVLRGDFSIVLDENSQFFFEPCNNRSHLFRISHKGWINQNLCLFLRHKSHRDNSVLHIAAVLFTVMGDFNALGISKGRCDYRREGNGTFGFFLQRDSLA